MRHLLARVALVERLDPIDARIGERRGAVVARSANDALHRDVFLQRDAPEGANHASVEIDDAHFTREILVRNGVAERLGEPLDEKMSAVAGHGAAVVKRRAANRAHGAGRDIDAGDLRGEAMLEERLVLRSAQPVLVSRLRRAVAIAPAHHRTGWHRGGWRLTALADLGEGDVRCGARPV